MAKMRCKIRSGARRSMAKSKANGMEDVILRRSQSSTQGLDQYKFCTDQHTTKQWTSGHAPRFTSWRREQG